MKQDAPEEFYASAAALQQFTSIAPVTERIGYQPTWSAKTLKSNMSQMS